MSALGCPACGSRDAVPKRVIVHSRLRRRWWLWGALIAAPQVVGNVHLCARCATEYCTSPAGVYVPRVDYPRQPPNGPPAERPHPLEQEARSLRDRDQDWG